MRRCTCEHLHLHPLDVDLDEVDLARDKLVERQDRHFPAGSGTKCVAPSPAVNEGIARKLSLCPRRRRGRGSDRSTLPSPFSATSSADCRGGARQRLDRDDPRPPAMHAGEEQRVVAGVGADIDDAQPARQSFGEISQLLRLEEQAAHLLPLDDGVEAGVGEVQNSRRRSGPARKPASPRERRSARRGPPRRAAAAARENASAHCAVLYALPLPPEVQHVARVPCRRVSPREGRRARFAGGRNAPGRSTIGARRGRRSEDPAPRAA